MEELSYFSDTIREQNGKAFDINVSEVYLVGLVHKLHYTIYMAQNLTFSMIWLLYIVTQMHFTNNKLTLKS